MSKSILFMGIFAGLLLASCSAPRREAALPNIILILADDMGYGDPTCYNPDSKVPTPHIDQLAQEGMMFTDAHTSSSVCTPTRYGILTGQYAWRGPLKQGVTWSYDTLIVDPRMSTISSVLQDQGYHTSCIGKWHLGLGWQKAGDSIRFDQPLTAGPADLGFDYFYGITASLDIPPYVYIQNQSVVQQPTGLTEGPSDTTTEDFWRRGPVSPDFDHYDVLNHLTKETEGVIRERAAQDQPFMVYFPLTAPHLPWIPKDEFKGVSRAGNYGDLVAEVDGVVGSIHQLVKELGIEDNTLIIFTSDNGSQFSSANMERYGHAANAHWRGRKGDIYEGGNRVPFIAKWPGKIAVGSQSGQLVSTTDFYATLVDLVDATPPADEVKDSQSFLPVMIGDAATGQTLRNTMVYQAARGMFAFRQDEWVLVAGKGSGGFMEVPDTTRIEEPYQLYNLAQDRQQTQNLYSERGDKVQELHALLEALVQRPETRAEVY